MNLTKITILFSFIVCLNVQAQIDYPKELEQELKKIVTNNS